MVIVRHSREQGLRSRPWLPACSPLLQLWILPKREAIDDLFEHRHRPLLVGCAATGDVDLHRRTGCIAQFYKLAEVLDNGIELQRRPNPLELLAGRPVETDLELVQAGANQTFRPIGCQQRTIGKYLHFSDSFRLGIDYPIFKLLVQQGLAEIVEMHFAAALAGALVDQPTVKPVIHAHDRPAKIAMRTNDALGIAGVRGLDPHDGRKLPPRKVHRRTGHFTNGLGW
jgi:hypothetical protein